MDKDGYHGYDKPFIDESAAKRIATALGWEPKREWVGLTVEDMATCINEPSWDLILRKAEQILKEKNQ